MSCNKGEIKKASYSYKKKTGKKVSVKSSCIRDLGAPGKGPKLITIPKEDIGLLSKHGYHLNDNNEERIGSITKALKHSPKLKVLKHLNALRTLFGKDVKFHSKIDHDVKWMQKHYEEL
jgi:hypothetical protein